MKPGSPVRKKTAPQPRVRGVFCWRSFFLKIKPKRCWAMCVKTLDGPSTQVINSSPSGLCPKTGDKRVTKKSARASRCCLLISLMLVACAPALAQHTENLGGNWNDPAGGKITNIIVDRYARRRLEKRPAARHPNSGSTTSINEASVRFRSTGTQLKTREIANLISQATRVCHPDHHPAGIRQ